MLMAKKLQTEKYYRFIDISGKRKIEMMLLA